MSPTDAKISAMLERYWGFDQLRSLQRDAIHATLAGRDALVILPTGGGKSLCYQLPALCREPEALTLVISPLIALMKDQIDGLRLSGFPAAALHSSVTTEEAAAVWRALQQGQLRLLMISPERLLRDDFLYSLQNVARNVPASTVCSVVIDEAHCISQWGHDFRPEYRRLSTLRRLLPGVSIQAYTATATERVRQDIIEQLDLQNPALLIGTFDRPNLCYRVLPRQGQGEDQIAELLGRQPGAAAIIYCISRKQTETLANALKERGIPAEAYHAGMDSAARSRVQEAFLGEQLHVIVATVAFGMGIDRGDVRLVIHASMPKSVEAYQQETGRAGRDGLPADCVLLYAASDLVRWGQLLERSGSEADPDTVDAQRALLSQLQRLLTGARCRHRALSEHFGQPYQPPGLPEEGCGACDICLGELEVVADSTDRARKILSCVARLRGSSDEVFGARYIAEVLRGATGAKIQERGHHLLSTYGLLKEVEKDAITSHIDQLVDLGALYRAEGKYPTVQLTAAAWPILRGEKDVSFFQPKGGKSSSSRSARRQVDGSVAVELSTPEQTLFESLRLLRRDIAKEQNVPPYVVFADATLEEMCKVRPGSLAGLLNIRGVGKAKIDAFGERFLQAIREGCLQLSLELDAEAGSRPRTLRPPRPERSAPRPLTESRRAAFDLFDQGKSLGEVSEALERAPSTTLQYLVEYIQQRPPDSLDPWVSTERCRRIEVLARNHGTDLSKPIFEASGGELSYEEIRPVLAWMRSRSPPLAGRGRLHDPKRSEPG
jgi:ATP-dependent DNA helicase RecQ